MMSNDWTSTDIAGVSGTIDGYCVAKDCTLSVQYTNRWRLLQCPKYPGYSHAALGSKCKCTPPLILYTFPCEKQQQKLRLQWVEFCNPEQMKTFDRSYRICSEHFTDGKPSEANPSPTIHVGTNDSKVALLQAIMCPRPAKLPQELNLKRKTCCYVVGCNNGFYRLTQWTQTMCPQHKVFQGETGCDCQPPYRHFGFPSRRDAPHLRDLWMEVIGRADPDDPTKLLEPNSSHAVCSKHFVHGRPTEENPAPEIFPSKEAVAAAQKRKVPKQKRVIKIDEELKKEMQQVREQKEKLAMLNAMAFLELSKSVAPEVKYPTNVRTTRVIGTKTLKEIIDSVDVEVTAKTEKLMKSFELPIANLAAMKFVILVLRRLVSKLRKEKADLKAQLAQRSSNIMVCRPGEAANYKGTQFYLLPSQASSDPKKGGTTITRPVVISSDPAPKPLTKAALMAPKTVLTKSPGHASTKPVSLIQLPGSNQPIALATLPIPAKPAQTIATTAVIKQEDTTSGTKRKATTSGTTSKKQRVGSVRNFSTVREALAARAAESKLVSIRPKPTIVSTQDETTSSKSDDKCSDKQNSSEAAKQKKPSVAYHYVYTDSNGKTVSRFLTKKSSVLVNLMKKMHSGPSPPGRPMKRDQTPTCIRIQSMSTKQIPSATLHTVQYAVHTDDNKYQWQTAADDLPEAECVVTGLQPNADYCFRVKSKNKNGESDYSPIGGPYRTYAPDMKERKLTTSWEKLQSLDITKKKREPLEKSTPSGSETESETEGETADKECNSKQQHETSSNEQDETSDDKQEETIGNKQDDVGADKQGELSGDQQNETEGSGKEQKRLNADQEEERDSLDDVIVKAGQEAEECTSKADGVTCSTANDQQHVDDTGVGKEQRVVEESTSDEQAPDNDAGDGKKQKFQPYQCSLCLQRFCNEPAYWRHMNGYAHQEALCSQCGKAVPRKKLPHHMKLHNEKSFSCSICGKSYREQCMLNYHMDRHNGVRRHKCPHCKKAFYDRSHLKVHIKIHTGDKAFACPMCDKRFVQKSAMKTHLLRCRNADEDMIEGGDADRVVVKKEPNSGDTYGENVDVMDHTLEVEVSSDTYTIHETHAYTKDKAYKYRPHVTNAYSTAHGTYKALDMYSQYPDVYQIIGDRYRSKKS